MNSEGWETAFGEGIVQAKAEKPEVSAASRRGESPGRLRFTWDRPQGSAEVSLALRTIWGHSGPRGSDAHFGCVSGRGQGLF